jgi:P27 family predicted phage terminase small subunit
VPVLKAMRILARVDRDALAVYCHIYARWRAAEDFLRQHGEVYPLRDEKGNVRCMQQFPQVAIARSLLQVVQSYQQEFGMTPSARTRVHEIPDFTRDALDVRFFGPH